MSGLVEWPVTAVVNLFCNKCSRTWRSEEYRVVAWHSMNRAADPAFDLGWRVFVGARTQHTYCPDHGPSVPMRQVHPAVTR